MTGKEPQSRRRKGAINSKFFCDVCQKAYSSKQALNVHSRLHSGDNPYRCDYCAQSFPQLVLLTAHVRSKHSHNIGEDAIVAITCDTCGKSYSSKNALRVHQRIHANEYPFTCDQCDAAFAQRVQLNAHVQRQHGDATFACEECAKVFRDETALKRHFKKKHDAGSSDNGDVRTKSRLSNASTIEKIRKNSNNDCSICAKTFSTKSALNLHHRIHSLTDRYACNICGATFAQKVQLTSHATRHDATKRFACASCQKAFGTRALLNQHEKTHNKEFRFACEICAKRFTTRGLLKRHMLIHEPPPLDEQFKCGICAKTFVYKHVRDDHVKRHLEDKAFKCSLCDKAFVKRFELDSHALTHSAEKRHQCIHCGRCFKRQSVAIVHERIHTGIRPFACKLCGAKMISFPMLKIHHRRAHPNYNNNCGSIVSTNDASSAASTNGAGGTASTNGFSVLKNESLLKSVSCVITEDAESASSRRTSKRKGVPVKLNVADDSADETPSTVTPAVANAETRDAAAIAPPMMKMTEEDDYEEPCGADSDATASLPPYVVVESPQHNIMDTSDMSYIDDLLPFTDGELEAILSEENIDFLKELWTTDSFLHTPVVDSDKLFTCEFCERNFEDFEMLVSHLNFEDSTRRCSFAPSYSILSL
ncbi:uncharacterized protein LOC141909030 [Tubulanus polymorphus]|uniref:uncharacterized protein LOC141909030 n=1 Tax=Tubulanus polymorphus TaxID=672921 RepID=UPI003DA298F5